ncbi:MAG: ribose-phosphate pyrophosphokinase [Chloroflexi bacterium]|nr:ribose-phosphate pyrophosphokinase [Chloroflexota bacterium]
MIDDLLIYSGTSNRPLAQATAELLGVALGNLDLIRFPDGEVSPLIHDSVRGKDVFIIQPTSPPVDGHIIELLLTLDAFKRASARRITAVIPYYGYSRQERKAKPREAISAKVIANCITGSGADRVMLLDIHAPAMQGFFDIPVDALTAVGLLTARISQLRLDDAIVIAPDTGRVKLAERFADALELPFGLMNKRRINGRVEVTHVVGDVRGRAPLVVDDIIAGGSLISQLPALIDAGAKPEITVAIIHPLLTGDAPKRLEQPFIRRILATDSVYLPPERRPRGFEVVSIAPLLAEAIRRTHFEESVSPLFQLE